jgi:hypothetical protein
MLLLWTTLGSGPISQEPELYGIIEVVNAIGEDRRKVAMWHYRTQRRSGQPEVRKRRSGQPDGRSRRRKRPLPPPDYQLHSGSICKAATIRPWIRAHLDAQAPSDSAGDAASASHAASGKQRQP